MADFLKLTLQNLNAPKHNTGVNSAENYQNLQENPISIHEVNKSPETKKTSSLTDGINSLENTDKVLNDTQNTPDDNIEAGNSIIANCSEGFKAKNEETSAMETNLTELTENVKTTGEALLLATNTLANLMSGSEEEQEANMEAIQDATQAFIEAQQNHTTAKAEVEDAIKMFDTNNSEKSELKEELKGYIDILEAEKESVQKDSTEDPETAEDLQSAIDKINEEIEKSENDSKTVSEEENVKRENINSEFGNLQDQYGISINDDNSVTQFYDDGSSRTFYVEKDENDTPSVTFQDTEAEYNEESDEEMIPEEENTDFNVNDDNYEESDTDNFLEEAEIFG